MIAVRATAPGRVNLIGEHTDYTGGLVLPMAIDLATTVAGERHGDALVFESADEQEAVSLPLDVRDPAGVSPPWGRYVAGVAAELRPACGFTGSVATTVPIGSGLSSSAALEVAVALALGFDGDALALAALCQRAEQRATGVPCGIMDQLASAACEEGHALRIDCSTLEVTSVPVPTDVDIVVVHSGQRRELAGSEYATRRQQCEAAVAIVGPLRDVSVAALDQIEDQVLRKRAHHVVTENARVDHFVEALREGALRDAGALMIESHVSLRDDFEVSTAVLDALVDELCATRGVYGARLTGAGFGGCVVALAEPGAVTSGWVFAPSAGAHVEIEET